MREYAENLGDAGSSDWREQEQAYIIQLVDRFWIAHNEYKIKIHNKQIDF